MSASASERSNQRDGLELVVVVRQVAARRLHEEVVDGLVDAAAAAHEPVVDVADRSHDADLEAGLLGHLAERRGLTRLVSDLACPSGATMWRRRARDDGDRARPDDDHRPRAGRPRRRRSHGTSEVARRPSAAPRRGDACPRSVKVVARSGPVEAARRQPGACGQRVMALDRDALGGAAHGAQRGATIRGRLRGRDGEDAARGGTREQRARIRGACSERRTVSPGRSASGTPRCAPRAHGTAVAPEGGGSGSGSDRLRPHTWCTSDPAGSGSGWTACAGIARADRGYQAPDRPRPDQVGRLARASSRSRSKGAADSAVRSPRATAIASSRRATAR